MTSIVWTSDMSVGIDHLDEHHRQMIDLTNQLGRAIATGNAISVVGQVLGELVRYVYYHFGEEERLMEESGYVGLDEHRRSHRVMANYVRALEATFDRDPSAVMARDLHVFLSEWLERHILEEDLLYAPSLYPKEQVA